MRNNEEFPKGILTLGFACRELDKTIEATLVPVNLKLQY